MKHSQTGMHIQVKNWWASNFNLWNVTPAWLLNQWGKPIVNRCGKSQLLPSAKLTVQPWQIGVGRLVSIKNWWFSGSMLINLPGCIGKITHSWFHSHCPIQGFEKWSIEITSVADVVLYWPLCTTMLKILTILDTTTTVGYRCRSAVSRN